MRQMKIDWDYTSKANEILRRNPLTPKDLYELADSVPKDATFEIIGWEEEYSGENQLEITVRRPESDAEYQMRLKENAERRERDALKWQTAVTNQLNAALELVEKHGYKVERSDDGNS